MTATEAFRAARDFLLSHREDPEAAYAGVPLARRGRVQLGDRLVRRGAGGRAAAPAGALAGHRGRRDAGQLRRDVAARSSQVAGWLREQRRTQGRPGAAVPRQHRAALGDHARRGEDRRGGDPGQHAAAAGRPGRPDRARQRLAWSCPPAPTPACSPASTAAATKIAVGDPVAGWLRYSDTETSLEHFEPDEPTARRRPAAALLHLRAPPRRPSWSSTPTSAIRSGTCPRCSGSACSRATCTSTSPRRAGPSTPGAASSRPGTPARPCSCTTPAGSTREALLDTLVRVRRDHAVRAADGLADARAAGPDRSGTCRCGSWSAPASRSTPR